MMGIRAASAALYASTITRAPSGPSAPPWIVASEAKMITAFPPIFAVAANIPDLSRGVINVNEEASANRDIRTSGSRGSICVMMLYVCA
jgi:hypothetical protein